MTVPAPPLPKIRHLLQALAATPFTGDQWVGSRDGYTARVYRRGSHALAAGVEAVRKASKAPAVTVWVPGYFCDDVLDPVRRLPTAVRFYPIWEDLTPDWATLEEWVAREPGPQVFILVHYFGFPNATREAKAFCDRHGMVLFEDAAHVFPLRAGIGVGYLMLMSPHKLLSVPSGGVLVAPKELAAFLHAPCGSMVSVQTLDWISRRLMQRLLVRLHIPWHFLRGYQATCTDPALKRPYSGDHEGGCDSYTLRLLTVMARHVEDVVQRRRWNYACLLSWTAGLVEIQPLFPRIQDGVSPYAFPLLVTRGCEEVVKKLQARGVPASRWPDLPPEVVASERDHKVTLQTYKQLLLLPVHQGLTPKQIDMVGQQLRGILTATS